MGRAIDMENDISALKIKLKKLENTVRGMVSKLDSIDEKSSKTIKVDLVEDVKMEEEDEKEKADNKGNGKGDKQSNNKSRKSSKKNI